jgi:hypothetical protein
MTFEYKVVPAPKKGKKAKGVRSSEARFANALQSVMNEMGADGWEYQRTDTLPCEERQGLTGRTTTFQNMLVFRRNVAGDIAELNPQLIEDQSAVVAAAFAADKVTETPNADERVNQTVVEDQAEDETEGPETELRDRMDGLDRKDLAAE